MNEQQDAILAAKFLSNIAFAAFDAKSIEKQDKDTYFDDLFHHQSFYGNTLRIHQANAEELMIDVRAAEMQRAFGVKQRHHDKQADEQDEESPALTSIVPFEEIEHGLCEKISVLGPALQTVLQHANFAVDVDLHGFAAVFLMRRLFSLLASDEQEDLRRFCEEWLQKKKFYVSQSFGEMFGRSAHGLSEPLRHASIFDAFVHHFAHRVYLSSEEAIDELTEDVKEALLGHFDHEMKVELALALSRMANGIVQNEKVLIVPHLALSDKHRTRGRDATDLFDMRTDNDILRYLVNASMCRVSWQHLTSLFLDGIRGLSHLPLFFEQCTNLETLALNDVEIELTHLTEYQQITQLQVEYLRENGHEEYAWLLSEEQENLFFRNPTVVALSKSFAKFAHSLKSLSIKDSFFTLFNLGYDTRIRPVSFQLGMKTIFGPTQRLLNCESVFPRLGVLRYIYQVKDECQPLQGLARHERRNCDLLLQVVAAQQLSELIVRFEDIEASSMDLPVVDIGSVLAAGRLTKLEVKYAHVLGFASLHRCSRLRTVLLECTTIDEPSRLQDLEFLTKLESFTFFYYLAQMPFVEQDIRGMLRGLHHLCQLRRKQGSAMDLIDIVIQLDVLSTTSGIEPDDATEDVDSLLANTWPCDYVNYTFKNMRHHKERLDKIGRKLRQCGQVHTIHFEHVDCPL